MSTIAEYTARIINIGHIIFPDTIDKASSFSISYNKDSSRWMMTWKYDSMNYGIVGRFNDNNEFEIIQKRRNHSSI